ncbi:hypothetical protein QMA0440_01198 [Yersinia ruckeri]|nr:hypothetical protein QMA0440_01198 [Yersinia ruckeri]KFE37245.1 hypothetical protein nADLYRO1b_3392 [Yersinia ruckeri]
MNRRCCFIYSAKLPKDGKPHFLVGLFLCLSEITHYASY